MVGSANFSNPLQLFFFENFLLVPIVDIGNKGDKMSYDNTVRCGWCRESGHNKRSCSGFKQMIEKWAASDDPYYQRRASAAKSRQKGRTKRCSFCSSTDHTIRRCDLHNGRVDTLARKWLEARKDIAARMHEHNFGVGSLVQYTTQRWKNGGYTTAPYLAIVTGIHYHTITDVNLSDRPNFHTAKPLEIHILTGDAAGCRYAGRLPRCIMDVGSFKGSGEYYDREYKEKIDQAVLLSGTTADVPSSVFDWKIIRKEVYKHLKRS